MNMLPPAAYIYSCAKCYRTCSGDSYTHLEQIAQREELHINIIKEFHSTTKCIYKYSVCVFVHCNAYNIVSANTARQKKKNGLTDGMMAKWCLSLREFLIFQKKVHGQEMHSLSSTYMHPCIHAHTHPCIHAHTPPYTHVPMHTHTHVHMHTCSTPMHTPPSHTYMHPCMYTHMHDYAHLTQGCTHIHTHTQAHSYMYIYALIQCMHAQRLLYMYVYP